MPRTAAQTKKLLKIARERFEQAQKADKDQREREKQDILFFNGEQWPEDIKNIRKGQNAQNGLPPVPARPMITINKTRGPVQQVLNQERQSDMGIEIVPADDFGEVASPIDETEIQLREGLVRRIQRDSKATDARTWAFGRATIAGRGFYGVMTRYVPGKTNDQEVYIHRFYNQACVTIDPAHEQPDGSDAEWGFVWADVPWDVYKSEYPKRNGKKNRAVDFGEDEWRNAGDDRKEWFITDGEKRSMRVGDYWYTEREARELVTLMRGDEQRVEWVDELDALPDLDGWVEVPDSRRDVIEKTIKWCKIDGCDDDVLSETEWAGPDIPIVKVLGEELQPTDGKSRAQGMVRPMREPGYGFNVMVSRWIELIGLAPLTPVMIEEGTIEGYEDWWQLANTRTLPYLPYKRTNLDGAPGNPPTVAPARNPDISAIAGSVQMFDQAIQDTSGHPDVSLGKVDPSIKSGRAIKALQEKAAFSSNHYLDNLQRSMRYEGQIINNLLYPIYGRPGRIARIINGEGDVEHVLLHQPMTQQGGRPVLAQDGDPQAKTYTLTKDAQFNVVIKVSKNFDTRREQEVGIIGELLSANPELMTWFGDLFFQNQDGPGHQQMADRAKVMLAPPIQQMLQAKQQGQDPQAAAQLAQAQQTIQQLQQQLEKVGKPTAVEEIRQEAQTVREAHALAFDREKLHADNETKIAVAELGAKVDRLALFLEERARLGVQAEADRGRAHEVAMAGVAHQQGLEASDQQAATAAEQAEANRQHEAEMAKQQAQQQGVA
jgi:portal protein